MKFFSLKIMLLLFLTACGTQPKISSTPSPVEPQIDSVSIIFSGDMMQHTPQITAARIGKGDSLDYTHVFSSISKEWKKADFTVVNLETTLAETPPYYGYPCFRSPVQILDALKKAGVTTLALANNHCVDMGWKGVQNTIRAINERDFDFVGINDTTQRKNILHLNKNNIPITLLNYTYGTNGMPIPKKASVNLIDTTLIKSDYAQARSEGAKWVIVFFHWGAEYQTKPNQEQKQLAQWCRNLGVDWIIGSHPHVAQTIDEKQKTVFSLGNLCSNQSTPYTQGGINIKLTLYSNGKDRMDWFPHWIDRTDKYKILTPTDTITTQKKEFLKSLADTKRIANQ